MNYWLFLIPLLSALVGWLAIHILIVLLFWPARPVSLAGIRLQGILPRARQNLTREIADWAAQELTTNSGIQNKIADPGQIEKIRPFLEVHIDDFLRNKLKEQMPMISMFIGEKTINSLKEIFLKEVENLFPQVMNQFAGNLFNESDIKQMVVTRLNDLSDEKIEHILRKRLTRETVIASGFAALIGFLIGLIQWLIVVLTL